QFIIPSESEGILEHMCDVPFHENSLPLDVSKDQFEDFSDSNDDLSSIDDDSFSIDNIDYVEASPPDSELVSSEAIEIVIPEVGGIDDDILLTIKDDILREKLLNVNLLIDKIEALNDNPTPSFDFMIKSSSTSLNSLLEKTNTCDNSLPEFETFCFDGKRLVCQLMNQDSYNSNSLDFDQPQPPQSPVIHQPPQELSIQEMEDLKQQYLDELKCLKKLLQEEQWAYLSTHPSKRLTSFCYDDDDDEDYTSAITPNEPVLSTEELDNSLSMGDEHLDTISTTESNEFIKSSVENLIPILNQFKDFSESNKEFSSIDDDSFSIDDIDYVEASPPDYEFVSSEVGGIDDDILLTIKDDILREKLLNVNLLIAKIEVLNANPTSSSDCKTKYSSTSLNSLLEETNTFDNSLPEFETFCFDVEEISSGSTTTYPDISFSKNEAFYDDYVKDISSGSPTTYFDSSLYASFIFDLSINSFPPADRSDFYEFTDELIPFISPQEYDFFLFKVEPNLRDFTKDVVEDISPTKEPQVLSTLPTHPTLQLNMKFQPSSEYLFTYVVWIFLPFLVYSVASHYLLSLRNEDVIFDPGICNSHFSRPDISHRCGTVKKFNTHRSHLNKCPMLIHGQNNPPLDVLLFHFYPLDSLKYGGNLVQLIDLKQALRGRHPMLIFLGFFFLLGYASVCSVLYMCLETRLLFIWL
nr:hypothetical protein [Tanacetum cinerariifolium]